MSDIFSISLISKWHYRILGGGRKDGEEVEGEKEGKVEGVGRRG